ncbi:hypothetical protein JXR93_00210 [bacterium]|nr:hypothetical protein [bacterium]
MVSSNFEHLFKLLESKRWYFFKNSEHILFDKKTSLFWIDPYYIFPEKLTIDHAQEKALSIDIIGLNGWRVASSDDLDSILISGFPFFETYKNMREGDWDFENDFDKVLFIPCYDKFSNFNLEDSERLLYFFKENNLLPDFGDLKSEEEYLMYRRFAEKKGVLNIKKNSFDSIFSQFNSNDDYFKKSLNLLRYIEIEVRKYHRNHSFLDNLNNFIEYITSQEKELLNITTPEMLYKFQKKERIDFNFLVEWCSKNLEKAINESINGVNSNMNLNINSDFFYGD